MAKYHVNPNTGVPRICTAASGRCPFGGDSDHYDTPEAAVAALEMKLEKELEDASASAPLSRQKFPTSSPLKPTGHNPYTDYSAIGQVGIAMASPGAKNLRQRIYTRHSGVNMNPYTGENENLGNWNSGQNSFVIVGKSDGKRVRVISSAGEFYSNPLDSLGSSVDQIKEQANGDGETRDMFVLGYISSTGNRFGWIPDKKINYFVFK